MIMIGRFHFLSKSILENSQGVMMKLAVSHASSAICEELYLIVDMGGEVIDVIIEHPVYGQLSGKLHLSSRYDVDQYVMKMTIHFSPRKRA